MPFRIRVIGTRTSSAPAGNAIDGLATAAEDTAGGAAAAGCGGAGAGAGPPGVDAGAGVALAADGAASDGLLADRSAGPLGLDVVGDVLAGDPSTAAAADDLGRGQAVLAQQPTDRRRHPGLGGAGGPDDDRAADLGRDRTLI